MQGVDADFDKAESALGLVDAELVEHLQDVKTQLKGNKNICYVSLNKDSHVFEIPEVCECRVLQLNSVDDTF